MRDQLAFCEELLRLEQRLADPEVRRAPAEMAALLEDDFREFGSSGWVFDKQAILEALRDEDPVEITLRDAEARVLAPDVVLLTYRARCQRVGTGVAKHTLRSTIWRRREGTWRAFFHQGTPSNDSRTK